MQHSKMFTDAIFLENKYNYWVQFASVKDHSAC